MTTPASSETTRRRGRVPLLSMEQCRQVASQFDGSTSTIDRLLAEWRLVVPGLQRHNITSAARRGGYASRRPRKPWTAEEDRFLRDHWHRLCVDEIAAALGRTCVAVKQRHKRQGGGGPVGQASSVRAQEVLARPDHRPPVGRVPPIAGRLIPPLLEERVSAQDNRFLSLLGWRRDEPTRPG